MLATVHDCSICAGPSCEDARDIHSRGRIGVDEGVIISTNGAVSWATIGRIVVAGFGIWVVMETWRIWLLLLTAAIVAAAIMPAARWGDRYRIPRIVAVSGVYLGGAFQGCTQ